MVVILESVGARATTVHDPALATTPALAALAAQSVVVDSLYANVPYTSDALLAVLGGIPPRLTSEVYYPGVRAPGLPALLAPHGYRSAVFTPAPLGVHGRAAMLRGLGYERVVGDGDLDAEGFERPNYSGVEEHAALAPSLAWADSVAARGERFLLTYLTVASHHGYGTPSSYTPHGFATGDAERDRYLEAVRYTDGFVADLVDAFRARGRLDSTLFVFVGDHGQAFGEHAYRYHGHAVWEEVIHVPAVLYAPGLLSEPRRVGGTWQQTDLVPTIADVLGFGVEGTLAGRSVLGPPADRPLVFSATSENQQMALRRGRHKFVYHYRRRPMQVFDLAADPGETTDLAASWPPAALGAAEAALLEARRRLNAAHVRPEAHDAGAAR